MMRDWRRRVLPWWGVAVLVWTLPAWADDPAAAAKDKAEREDRQLEDSLGTFKLFVGPNRAAALTPQRVSTWSNPTRGQLGRVSLVLWTGGGRPEALASVYPWQGHLVYEYVSLARTEDLSAWEDGRAYWSPGAAGVTFHDVPDAPVPGDVAAARLAQAKAIAERFNVIIKSANGAAASRESMRLLPKPIYRCALAEAKTVDPELIDGAMFAFVQGTDPEAVLLVEAVRHGEGMAWQYAFGRATVSGVEARLGQAVVWTASAGTSTDPAQPLFVRSRRLVE